MKYVASIIDKYVPVYKIYNYSNSIQVYHFVCKFGFSLPSYVLATVLRY
jgi:hypothetical protein